MVKLYICCSVLFIGSSEVGLDIDIKFAHVDDQNCQVWH